MGEILRNGHRCMCVEVTALFVCLLWQFNFKLPAISPEFFPDYPKIKFLAYVPPEREWVHV